MIQLAGCVITDNDGNILLLHRVKGRDQWELPGGRVEPGENAATAAIREVREELGIDVEITSEIGRAEFTEGDNVFSYVWFRAKITDGAPRILEQKFSQCRYLGQAEIEASHNLSENMKQYVAFLQRATASSPAA